jgi:hypothetical protein
MAAALGQCRCILHQASIDLGESDEISLCNSFKASGGAGFGSVILTIPWLYGKITDIFLSEKVKK